MASPRNALLTALDKCRSILGPAVMDLRPTSISIITRTWSDGTGIGDGFPTDGPSLTLPSGTKVRHLSQREIAASGGLFEDGDVLISKITPQFISTFDGTIGGFTEAQLAPQVTAPAQEVVYQLAQQSGAAGISGDYSRVELRRDYQLHFEIVVRRKRTTPGPL